MCAPGRILAPRRGKTSQFDGGGRMTCRSLVFAFSRHTEKKPPSASPGLVPPSECHLPMNLASCFELVQSAMPPAKDWSTAGRAI
ncbi:hypothetical protein V8C42DRAFT_317099 [Trichoderma barbatum]